MAYLILVSLLWAFSFGLIRVSFGSTDPILLAAIRLGLAALLFLPFLRGARRLGAYRATQLIGIGAIQYGLMYTLLFASFQHIGPRSYLIALFTLTTPIFVLLFASLLEGRPSWRGWLAAGLAVAGAAVIQWRSELSAEFWTAFLLLQGSNACFAFGQIAWRHCRAHFPGDLRDHQVFAWVFLGAVLCCGLLSLFRSDWSSLLAFSLGQWSALIYLGLVASGLAFFWWNRGATLVTPPTLAVMNNLKVPLAVLVSLIVFREWRTVDWPQFLAGTALIAGGLAVSLRSDRTRWR